MVKVYFTNKTKREKLDLLEPKIKRVLLEAVKTLKIKKNLELNIILVNPEEIKKLNQKYFKNNIATDVISFKSEIPAKKSLLLGDIVICSQVAAKNAKSLKHSLEKEIQLLALHGLLHLTDLGHEKPKDLQKWHEIFKKLENIIK